MHRAQVFLLRPNKEQSEYLSRSVGIARFAYNWALEEWKRQAKEWWTSDKKSPFPTAFSLQKQFNAIKRSNWPWTSEVSQRGPEAAIFAVGQAFDAYKAGIAGYPKFKSKGKCKDSFVAASNRNECKIDGKRVRLSKIGWIRIGRSCRWKDGQPIRAVISRIAGKWYVAVSFEIPDPCIPVKQNVAAGVDLGIKTPIKVVSSGQSIDFGIGLAQRLNVERRKLRRFNKELHRRLLGSNRRKRTAARLAKIHKRMADIRSDFQHKATATVCALASNIGVESLHVVGMLRNSRLARSISDIGFAEIRRQFSYKAENLVLADRFYPSSKTCSCCGSVKEKIALSARTFVCDDCGFSCDRDENAARNLEKLAANRAVTARGDGSSVRQRKLTLRSLSMKRESAKIGIKS